MPMQLIRRKDNLSKHDATIIMVFDPEENTQITAKDILPDPERGGVLFHCGIGVSTCTESQLQHILAEELNRVLSSMEEGCSRLAVVPVLPQKQADAGPAYLPMLQGALIHLLEDTELRIDLVLPEDLTVSADDESLQSCRAYLAQQYTGEGNGFVNQILAGILGNIVGNVSFGAAKLAPGSGEAEKLSMKIPAGASRELRQFIEAEESESFYSVLKKEIEKRGMTEVECYKRANISRKLYSKMKNQPFYKPSKQTAAAFAIALRMDLEDAKGLLESAGYSLTNASLFDMIIKFHIKQGKYDIYEINNVLYDFDQCLLGG